MPWCRYSQYEVRERRICPKPNARLESYDPWADYETGKQKAGDSPPYLSLLNLLNEIRPEVHFETEQGLRLHPALSEIPEEDLDFEDGSGVFLACYRNPFAQGAAWRAPPIQASERAIRRILEWTNHYGLLG